MKNNVFKKIYHLTIIILVLFFLSCAYKGPSKEVLSAYIEVKNLYQKGYMNDAADKITELLLKDPEFHQAKLLKGKILFFQNKIEEASKVFAGLEQKHPGYREASIWQLRCDLELGNHEEAQEKIRTLLEFDSQDPRLLFLMAQGYMLKDDYKKALDFLNRAALFKEEYAKISYNQAKIYQQFMLHDKALEELNKAHILLDPDSLLKTPIMNLINELESKIKK